MQIPKIALQLCLVVLPRYPVHPRRRVALECVERQPEQVKIDVSAITEDTRIDRIGFDSISILDFIYDVEDRFRVQTEIADLVSMERVGDLIDYLEARLVG